MLTVSEIRQFSEQLHKIHVLRTVWSHLITFLVRQQQRQAHSLREDKQDTQRDPTAGEVSVIMLQVHS